MSYAEMLQWFDYYGVEPFGAEIIDMRHAELQATIANSSGNLKKAVSPQDFMRKSAEETGELSDYDAVKEWLSV